MTGPPVGPWHKLGLLYRPSGRPWAVSHASLPVPVHHENDLWRVYFASRDGDNRSHVGAVIVRLREGEATVVDEAAEPLLAPGGLGCFDDHGVYASSVVREGDRTILYYIGWNPGVRPPLFYASIGLAVSDDGGRSFRRCSVAPIMARSDHDPCLVTSPFVLRDDGRYRMWYVSGLRWEETEDGARSIYHVKYAESDDGRSWHRDGTVSIELAEGERNIARPWVVRGGSGYRMWYARAGTQPYRVGYAESPDGRVWRRRDDEVGIGPSADGWDADLLAYPAVVMADGLEYMFYNGNGYGREGFGVAVRESV